MQSTTTQPKKPIFSRVIGAVTLMTLLAFVLRMVGLVQVPPRWDEGWSIAHASLSLGDLFTITAEDVHPPLFYLLLGAWQSIAGVSLFGDRFLAVMMSLPAVPLAFVAARRWSGSLRLGLIATGLIAWLPLLVYYSAVIRMYALVPSFVLLAVWGGLRLLDQPRVPVGGLFAFVVGAAGAMYTLYHAVWVLAGLAVYVLVVALLRNGKRFLFTLRWVALGTSLALLVYVPWAIFAIPQFLSRASADTGNTAQAYPVTYFLKLGVEGLVMSRWTGQPGFWVVGGLLLSGLIAFGVGRLRARGSAWAGLLQLALPLMAIIFTLLGVSIGARNWAFNERMLVCAVALLGLWLAWALDQLAQQWHFLAGVAVLALIGVYFNASANLVYQKALEVFDPYNPHTYARHILPQAQPDDLVVFNVLSPAGFYVLDRQATDPAWSYALTWDPVIEPAVRWQARLSAAAQMHQRIWVVLYRGLAGRNGDLRGWLDTHYYPATAEWGEEGVFYGLYGAPRADLIPVTSVPFRWTNADGFDLQLVHAELPSSAQAGDVLPVALRWRAGAALKQNDKVFVHAVDAQGNLVAQHDAQPLNDLRPMTSLPVGIDVEDHHGLALPQGFSGQVRIEVGIYDPASGQRVLTDGGQEVVELGRVDVKP
jgi:hypothetical protein